MIRFIHLFFQVGNIFQLIIKTKTNHSTFYYCFIIIIIFKTDLELKKKTVQPVKEI